MVDRFRVAFSAFVLALLALYAPLILLNSYSAMLSEVVYEGFGYKVVYKSLLIPILSGDKTRVVISVRRNGEPLDFGYTLSGITLPLVVRGRISSF